MSEGKQRGGGRPVSLFAAAAQPPDQLSFLLSFSLSLSLLQITVLLAMWLGRRGHPQEAGPTSTG